MQDNIDIWINSIMDNDNKYEDKKLYEPTK